MFCSDYSEEHCEKLNHPLYVCDACDLVDRCPLEKFHYDPAYAQQEYAATLRETRHGFNLTQQGIDAIDAQVTSLIYELKFPFAIFSSHQRSFICIPHSEPLHAGSPIFYSKIERAA